MSEMVERVARALYEAKAIFVEQDVHIPGGMPRWEDVSGKGRREGLALARTAIAAMRSPPLGMRVLPEHVRSVVKAAHLYPGRVASEVWRAMIDEMLK